VFARARKRRMPGIVFACDTEPVAVTKSCRNMTSPADLGAALDTRLQELSLAWNTSSS
jgi:dihydromethanopterin reductase (acceptor)